MKDFLKDTPEWQQEFDTINSQTHFDKLWKLIEDISDKEIDDFFNEINNDMDGKNEKEKLQNFFKKIIKDRQKLQKHYQDLLDVDIFEDGYMLDTDSFKETTLAKEIPVIKYGLMSKSESMKEWQAKFKKADGQILCDTFYNIVSYGQDYVNENDEEKVLNMQNLEDCSLFEMEENACYLTGVIGNGIVANVLNHLYPRVFPGEYKLGVLALYILSGSEEKGIDMVTGSSEFVMDKDESGEKRDYNYFYPYAVYAMFTHRLYKLLCTKISNRYNQSLSEEYRFWVTNAFYEYVTLKHKDELNQILGENAEVNYQKPW